MRVRVSHLREAALIGGACLIALSAMPVTDYLIGHDSPFRPGALSGIVFALWILLLGRYGPRTSQPNDPRRRFWFLSSLGASAILAASAALWVVLATPGKPIAPCSAPTAADSRFADGSGHSTSTCGTDGDAVALRRVIDRLDLSSFNNSTGPRREKGKITFANYGFSAVKFYSTKAIISDAERSWQFVVMLLAAAPDAIRICLEDRALNGGTYHTENAYLLKLSKSNFLQASPVRDPACPSFAK